jgi:hypothetical protein
LLVLLATAVAEEPPADEDADRAVRLKYLVERLQSYTVAPAEGAPFKLQETPLMRWQNAISGADGGVFVWTQDGRPRVIGKVHLNPKKWHYVGSIVSLSGEPFTARAGDTVIWRPETAGLALQAVKGAGRPAAQEATRLTQMRAIARKYTFTSVWGEQEPSDWTLRLMPTPLHRYSSKSQGVVDGALFGFAQGTNPEAILMVEATQSGGKPVWHAGVTRLTRYAVKALLEDRTVLDVPRIDRTKPEDTYHYLHQPLAEFPMAERP